jgi:hypothetical protein
VTATPTITWPAVAVRNRTLYAGRKPPSAIVITGASGSVVETRDLDLSAAGFLASLSGRRAHAC